MVQPFNDFAAESAAFDDEVKATAAKLVREGTPPYNALAKAREIVSQRRRQRALEKRIRETK
ncbi:hypothetical protein GWO43_30315 [candidate division KSB1 bacterium]|nr:hypothetical protein [candidate division KSB1 bacterium]NIV70653.1 hypothetical protein [Phycisphaerae bacterium]NIS28184.1 hypothetical protein [candidate division KSB1 bacterium]NIT75077.1 hypothetical protein [candidate division KSB1 bacterium]NIU28863.1 hypothetical protein [candidate division KSB1 bacterium]